MVCVLVTAEHLAACRGDFGAGGRTAHVPPAAGRTLGKMNLGSAVGSLGLESVVQRRPVLRLPASSGCLQEPCYSEAMCPRPELKREELGSAVKWASSEA